MQTMMQTTMKTACTLGHCRQSLACWQQHCCCRILAYVECCCQHLVDQQLQTYATTIAESCRHRRHQYCCRRLIGAPGTALLSFVQPKAVPLHDVPQN